MFTEKDQDHPDEKISMIYKSESSSTSKMFSSKPQELTLSYLCDNNAKFKGNDVIFSNNSLIQEGCDEKWVERDFMNLSKTKSNNNSSSSKRDILDCDHGKDEIFDDNCCSKEKRPKLESSTLNLSLALPDVSLSLNNDVNKVKPSRSVQSLGGFDGGVPAPSHHTQTTCSNDFTAASLSYSYSHPFSHNPSCSMTRNSTENYEYSVGRDDQIWNAGEGTNGSVHSRFRPIGDGLVALNNNTNGGGGNGGFSSMIQNPRVNNKDSCNNNGNNSLYRTASSENHLSFFPSELPARPRLDTYSGDSRRKDSDNLRGLEGVDAGVKPRKLSRPERILREIVSESIPIVTQIIQELTEEVLESIKEYLRNLITVPEKKDELVGLQNRLGKRSDLTKETLLKCQKDQLEILVAVKMGLASFISGKCKLPPKELVEIFLYNKCRNMDCPSILPVDDCDCKFCSANNGFCSSCMCPVCMKFDCANNTCSWVGCDVCSHWCHAACGIQKNLIRPGPSLKGPKGTTEMQFHCIACNHASEMFGFVKDVFVCCAKDWGLQTLMKELDCVHKVFKGSEDIKGKQLHIKAEELLSGLETKTVSSLDACNTILQFFNYADNISDFPVPGVSAKEMMPTETSLRKDAGVIPPATLPPPKYGMYSTSSSGGRRDSISNDINRNDFKAALLGDLKMENEFQMGNLARKEGLDSLERVVRIKEAEARMFQSRADEARGEAEAYRRKIRAKSEELEEEYAEKLSKLCLQETEDSRRKKLEELKVLEHSHGDYYNMKLRMQAEIAGLLERMEATKQQWV